MQSPSLDRRIRIEKPTITQSDTGQPVTNWTKFAEPWANVQQTGGREYFTAEQQVAEISAVFTIRYRTGLDETMRIIYDGLTYNIQARPRELGRREYQEIAAKIVRV